MQDWNTKFLMDQKSKTKNCRKSKINKIFPKQINIWQGIESETSINKS
jgi:hypothetical protein